jgi:hypothetical protein
VSLSIQPGIGKLSTKTGIDLLDLIEDIYNEKVKDFQH